MTAPRKKISGKNITTRWNFGNGPSRSLRRFDRKMNRRGIRAENRMILNDHLEALEQETLDREKNDKLMAEMYDKYMPQLDDSYMGDDLDYLYQKSLYDDILSDEREEVEAYEYAESYGFDSNEQFSPDTNWE